MKQKSVPRNKGPAAIRQDLMKKGIDKGLQEQVLGTFSHDEQVKLAMELAEKQVRAGEQKTPTQVKQKIQDVLMRKGYSFTVVKEVLNQIEFERADDEWTDIDRKTRGEDLAKIFFEICRKRVANESKASTLSKGISSRSN